MNYAILDIETTGGNSKTGKITEIAVFLHNGAKVIDVYETLVNPGVPIPPFITKLTGISDSMVADAPGFADIAKQLDAFTANAVFVAHNAHFDYGFVREEFRKVGIDFKRKKLCTVQLSRHAFPGLASYSLDKITHELNIKLSGHHRAAADARATAALFDRIIEAESEKGLFDMHFGMPNLSGILSPYIDEAFLNSIPDDTGVVRFYDAADKLILSKRSANVLTTICEKLKMQPTDDAMRFRKTVHRIDYQLTGSQLVAQLLEAEDAICQQPEFNHGRFSLKVHFAACVKMIDEVPHLMLQKHRQGDDAVVVYSNFFEGKSHFEALSKEWNVPIANIGSPKRTSPALPIVEGVHLEAGISPLRDRTIIIDEGRYASEHTRVMMENGVVIGYGYYDADFQFSPNPFDDIQVLFKPVPELEYVVRKFIEKGRFEKIIKLKSDGLMAE